MPRYKTKTRKRSEDFEDDSGYDSGYESDGGTEYSPVKPLGAGEYAQARLFKSISNKAVTVLNPVKTPGDFGEAKIKQRFFQTLYPNKKSHLFSIGTDYRLVVPYIQYTPYNKLIIDTREFHKILFHSAIKALKDCHDKGMIVLDLKTDNIYYDSSTQKSYLIDGGLSVPTGTTIDPFAFQKSSQEIVEEYKKEYWHIPPECWSVKPTAVVATAKMDIYCLGILMYDLLENPSSEIQLLIDSCLEKDPEKRPTLAELITSLESIKDNEKEIALR
ncbi:protein kinase domain-containing protein [Legionella cincinnatiensis]|uniref:Protein kinase n=1 Tax=Legionella cincinnatiensis TaxID=28085 RepID=A0A378IWS9_9GAMM|nr:protein kinase [Legionella cincinnatiensis]KTC86201.1 protein kinase [Legionella cincinnatiensis]STX36474.1 protein kinase [Legionella cincinnatiensis]